MAGARPHSTAVRTAAAAVKTSTVPSIAINSGRWISGGLSANITFSAPQANARPRAAPAPDINRDSVRRCATVLTRPAPKAMRMAVSRERDAARTSVRFARFAQVDQKEESYRRQ